MGVMVMAALSSSPPSSPDVSILIKNPNKDSYLIHMSI